MSAIRLQYPRAEEQAHTTSVDISLYDNADASDAIERNLFVFVVSPVAHQRHVFPPGLELLVTCRDRLAGFQDLPSENSSPSTITVSLSSFDASFRACEDSTHEL
jgi:hypothetical protein